MKTSRSKKKDVPVSKLRDRALALFQKLRRIEEADCNGYVRCMSCGAVMHWKEAQGGHYIPRANRATEMEHDNVWPQCQRCNGFLHGNSTPYRYNLVRKIGEERVSRIEDMAFAYKGCDESMNALSDDDKISVVRTRGKQYYLNRIDELKRRLKEAGDV